MLVRGRIVLQRTSQALLEEPAALEEALTVTTQTSETPNPDE